MVDNKIILVLLGAAALALLLFRKGNVSSGVVPAPVDGGTLLDWSVPQLPAPVFAIPGYVSPDIPGPAYSIQPVVDMTMPMRQVIPIALEMNNTAIIPDVPMSVNVGIVDNALNNPAIPVYGGCGLGYVMDDYTSSPTYGTCQPAWLYGGGGLIVPIGGVEDVGT